MQTSDSQPSLDISAAPAGQFDHDRGRKTDDAPGGSCLRDAERGDGEARPDADAELQRQARITLAAWVDRANALFDAPGRGGFAIPTLRFDLRGRAAGLAVFSRRRRSPDLIRINPDLLRRYPREMLDETLPHEFAHVVAHRLYGATIKPHGAEWRGVMAAFGKSPDVCHNMAAEPTRRLRRYRYRCACPQGVELTSIRHRRAQQGAGYVCRRCGEQLRYSGERAEQASQA